jgi:hypothetical protein
MQINTPLAKLTAVFRTLGAPNPESWARSEITEGIPQLARFLFLRQAWRNVISDDGDQWISNEIEYATKRPAEPGAGAGLALKRLLAAGASPKDLTELVRVMQWQLLFNLCYQLEDPGDVEPEVSHMAWALFEVDADGNPIQQIGGLHESVLETDPTGREMRPKPAV